MLTIWTKLILTLMSNGWSVLAFRSYRVLLFVYILKKSIKSVWVADSWCSYSETGLWLALISFMNVIFITVIRYCENKFLFCDYLLWCYYLPHWEKKCQMSNKFIGKSSTSFVKQWPARTEICLWNTRQQFRHCTCATRFRQNKHFIGYIWDRFARWLSVNSASTELQLQHCKFDVLFAHNFLCNTLVLFVVVVVCFCCVCRLIIMCQLW